MSERPDLPGDLLALAREDLVSAQALDKDERVSDSPVGFHAQQAVEKALKAAIASRDLEFPFTHDLGVLMSGRREERSAMGCARHRVGGCRDSPAGKRPR